MPSAPGNGTFNLNCSQAAYFGAVCTAKCLPGFIGWPAPSSTCQADGLWSRVTGKCIPGESFKEICVPYRALHTYMVAYTPIDAVVATSFQTLGCHYQNLRSGLWPHLTDIMYRFISLTAAKHQMCPKLPAKLQHEHKITRGLIQGPGHKGH